MYFTGIGVLVCLITVFSYKLFKNLIKAKKFDYYKKELDRLYSDYDLWLGKIEHHGASIEILAELINIEEERKIIYSKMNKIYKSKYDSLIRFSDKTIHSLNSAKNYLEKKNENIN